MLFIRLPLILVWLVISCVIGLGMCLMRWGDLDLDRDFGHLFAWGVLRICGFDVRVEGLEHLEARQPCIYVANHQSALDMATFGSIYPKRTVVVGKKELLWIPFFGLFFKAAGNIILDRQKRVSAIAGLSKAVESIKERQVSVWIFPEGTRNRTDDVMMPFKKGAFYMALQAKVPIVPIVCSSLSELASWKQKRMSSGTVRIRVLPPIDVTQYGDREIEKLAHDTRDKMVEALRSLADPSSLNQQTSESEQNV